MSSIKIFILGSGFSYTKWLWLSILLIIRCWSTISMSLFKLLKVTLSLKLGSLSPNFSACLSISFMLSAWFLPILKLICLSYSRQSEKFSSNLIRFFSNEEILSFILTDSFSRSFWKSCWIYANCEFVSSLSDLMQLSVSNSFFVIISIFSSNCSFKNSKDFCS